MLSLNRLTTLVFMLCIGFTSFANSSFENVVFSEKISISIEESTRNSALISNIALISNDRQVEIVANKKIEFVQIFNSDDQLVYALPIESEKLTLGVNTLDSGVYFIKLVVEGEQDFVVAKLNKE